jgi:hypothetical protein
MGSPAALKADTRGDDRLFQNGDGSTRLQAKWKDGKLKKSDSTECMIRRVQQKTGINGKRGFCTLTKTGAMEIEKINPAATEMYLAHVERGMKRNYAQRNGTALGEVMVKLEKVFDLKGDKGTACDWRAMR